MDINLVIQGDDSVKALLSEKQINDIILTLNIEQKNFLENRIKQNKKSKWLETLAGYKGVVIDEKMGMEQIKENLENWVLLDILDGGYGKRPYMCECGNSLRFQYVVYHSIENRTYKLGSTCFENYTMLSPVILRDIIKGFYHIDLERDEILIKYKKKAFFNITPYIDADIPIGLIDQVKIGLPLTDAQIKKIMFLFEQFMCKKAEKESKQREFKLREGLSKEQQKWISDMFDEEEQLEIINKLNKADNKFSIKDLKKIGASDIIINHVELELPLINRMELEINSILRKYNMSFIRSSQELPSAEDYKSDNTLKLVNDITYDEFIEENLDKLKMVREREAYINKNLKNDWLDIQNMVKDLKNENPINYKRFQLLLSNLLTSLGIYNRK
jgi:hypothetical protein